MQSLFNLYLIFAEIGSSEHYSSQFCFLRMKKLISYILLTIMLAVSVQPALAMHFCKGVLSEVTLSQDSSVMYGENMECGFKKQEPNKDESSFENIPCCVIKNLQLKTDNYNVSNLVLTFSALQDFVVELIPLFLVTLHDFDFLKNDTELTLNKYPPNGLGNEQFDILNHICIYRL